ncbi:MAG: protein kinase domain-containing protein [Planctomycetota bacterium]|jgi:serine/threonine protein kinase/HEAT repeat protein
MFERLGEYEIKGKLGEGGMGTVYRGYQASLDREVAIKTLSESFASNETFVARFHREARAAASLVHPNVIQVFSIGCEEGVHYFAMEYIRGKDLSEHLKEGRQFTLEESLDIIIKVVQALTGAEEVGLVHRDIKPSNIMMTERNQIKLTDFGLAKTTDSDLTEAGTVVGTANYMSPEQGQGLHLDGRSDMYSLGVVFYELVTGSPPFLAESAPAVLYKHVYEMPASPRSLNPDLPEAVEAVILQMLRKNPEERHASAGELLEDLIQLRSGQKREEKAAVPASISPAPPSPSAAPAQAASGLSSSMTVSHTQSNALIVDHTGFLGELFGTLLSEKGFAIQSVTDGDTAIATAVEGTPKVILLDMEVSNPDGVEVLQAFQEKDLHSRVMAIASPKVKEELEAASPYPISAFLTKPINHHELRQRLEQLIDTPLPMEEEIALSSDSSSGMEPGKDEEDLDKRFILIQTLEPYNQILFRQVLESDGHRVAGVTSAAEVKTILEEDLPDLLILEVSTEDTSALEVMALVKENGWKIPVVSVVCEHESELIRQVQDFRMGPVLTKPVRVEAIRGQVNKALSESEQLPKHVLCSGTFARLVSQQKVKDQAYTVFDFARSLQPIVPKASRTQYLESIQEKPARAVCNLIAGILKNYADEKDSEAAMRFVRYAYRKGNFEVRNLSLVLLRELLTVEEEAGILSKIITDEDFRMRIRVIQRIGDLKLDSAAPLIVRFLNDDVWKVRTAAAECLEMLGGTAVIEPLVHYYARTGNALPDRLRKIVLEGKSAEKIAHLERMARKGLPHIRAYVIRMMAAFQSRQTIPLLIDLLQDTQAQVRAAAAETLGQMKNQKSLLGLFNTLSDSSAEVQKAVTSSLLEFDLTSGTHLLIQALAGRERRISMEAIRFLLRLNKSPRELEKALSNLESETTESRKYLSLLLTTCYGQDEVRLKEVIRGLNSKDRDERSRVACETAQQIAQQS